MPFIPAQYEWLKQLECDWTWAIAEGPARPLHCSSWRSPVAPGRSPDGTADCIDKIAASDPRVIVKHQDEWDGIIDMNNACLPDYPCLLMQMSSDEVWRKAAVESAIKLFKDHPEKTAASVYCRLYLGPEIVVSDQSSFGNENEENFRVLWRFEPGMRILSYEPPLLSGNHVSFSRAEMMGHGVYFDHLYFFHEKQVRQKEDYYAKSHVSFARMHVGITSRWKALQCRQNFPSTINDVFPWAPRPTLALKVERHPFQSYLEQNYDYSNTVGHPTA